MPLTVTAQAVWSFHGTRDGWGNLFAQKTPVPPKRWPASTKVMTRAARLLYAPIFFKFPLIARSVSCLRIVDPSCAGKAYSSVCTAIRSLIGNILP